MTYILNVNPFHEIDINIYKTIIISQISSLLNGILFSLDFGQYARYAYFINSFRIAQTIFGEFGREVMTGSTWFRVSL